MENIQKKDDHQIWAMFNRIAPRYDMLNHALSMGIDILWRKKLVKMIQPAENHYILDAATGTGDLAIELATSVHNINYVTGVDMAEHMLDQGREKIKKKNLNNLIQMVPGDIMQLPFKNNNFTACTIAFGIRNVSDIDRSLAEFYRIMQNNGRLLILEFSLPKNKLIRSLYLFYFRHILPYLAGLFSGSLKAYQYLNKSVESFPHGEQFCQIIKKAGFREVKAIPLSFGIASIYIADK